MTRGAAAGMDDWLQVLQLMNAIDQRFAPGERRAVLHPGVTVAGAAGTPDPWPDLRREVRAAIGQSLPADDPGVEWLA